MMNIFVKMRGLDGHSSVFSRDKYSFDVRGVSFIRLVRVGPAIIALMR